MALLMKWRWINDSLLTFGFNAAWGIERDGISESNGFKSYDYRHDF